MHQIDTARRGAWANFRRFPLLYGLATALFWALLGTLCIGVYAHTAMPTDRTMVIAKYTIHCIAIFFGSLSASRSAGRRGWYYGGATALMYSFLMLCIGMVAYDTFSFDAAGWLRALVLTAVGAFCGVIGVNTTNGTPDD
jgi:putative membrane protein (TIGR04086 family)